MDRVLLSRASFSCLILLLIGGFFLTMASDSHADSFEELRANLPERMMDWVAEPGDQLFDRNTIFDYINGGGELYRAYNLQRCLSRRYTTPDGPAIVLDIFDVGTSKDAFGVFTHNTDGNVVHVGQGARSQPGWLRFWKSRFFISLYTEEETPASSKAVKELARQVAAQIKTEGARPKILAYLPPEGLQSHLIRYLHHPVVMNYHYYISDENILNISNDTDVVLARYRGETGAGLLLLVEYLDPKLAARSLTLFLKYYLPDANQTGSALLEDGKWAAVRQKGHLLAIVLESESRDVAEGLLTRVFNRKQ
jgi:hypothetical protein